MAPRCIEESENKKRMVLPKKTKKDEVFNTTEIGSLPGFTVEGNGEGNDLAFSKTLIIKVEETSDSESISQPHEDSIMESGETNTKSSDIEVDIKSSSSMNEKTSSSETIFLPNQIKTEETSPTESLDGPSYIKMETMSTHDDLVGPKLNTNHIGFFTALMADDNKDSNNDNRKTVSYKTGFLPPSYHRGEREECVRRSSSSTANSEDGEDVFGTERFIHSPAPSDCRSSTSSCGRSSVTSPYARTFIYSDWPTRRSKSNKLKLFSEEPVPCAHCKKKVESKYLLYTLDRYWHEKCLKCDFCRKPLFKFGDRFYFRQGAKFCHDDFARTFGGQGCCSICDEGISPTEYVLKFNGKLSYHLRCFKCTSCEGRFCVGDEVKIVDPKHLACKKCDKTVV